MTRRLRVLAIVMLGAAVPACSVLAGLTEDYRLADGGGVTPPGEGGTDGNPDKDGTLPDGFVPDGGTDAPIDQLVADGGPFSCATVDKTNLDYCNDFEDGAASAMAPNAYWTGIQNSSGAPITIVAGSGFSNTHGLDVDSTTAATGSRNIFLHKTLGAALPIGSYLRYDVEFEFKVVSPLAGDYLAVGVLNFISATPEDHGVAVYPTDDVVGRLMPKANGVTNALDTWHHAHLVLEHAAAGVSFNRTMSIDGVSVDTSTISTAGASLTELRFGIFYTAPPAGRMHVVLDNIVARRKKP